MIDPSFLSELSSLDLTAPQYQAVLSMLARLLTTVTEAQAEASTAYERGKRAEREHERRTNRARNGHGIGTEDGFPPKEKSNPPFPPVAKATAQSMNDFVWRECPSRLEAMGLQERAARSNLGRWLKSAKAETVLAAIEAAEKAGTRDPVPYITEALKPKILSFGRDWEIGAARQIEERQQEKPISDEERQANLMKLLRMKAWNG